MKKAIPKMLAVLATLAAAVARAAEITQDEAQRAVETWVGARPAAHMGAQFVSSSGEVATYADDEGKALFHVVNLDGGGYVVTSADDRISPIVAFSDNGEFVASEENPLWEMLYGDLPERIASKDAAAPAAPQGRRLLAASATSSQRDSGWDDLLGAAAPVPRGFQLYKAASAVSDVRVDPLVVSKWGQDYAVVNGTRYKCYNYYTPNNYYCGCVATAFAQLMRFHEWPKTAVTAKTKLCYVDGWSQYLTMKGGTYDWANMPLDPDHPGSSTLTTAQQQAIGKLCYDAGVSIWMSYSSSGSGAIVEDIAVALAGDFHYSNAKARYTGSTTTSFGDAEIKRGLYPNLDAGKPVILGIRGASGKKKGHTEEGNGTTASVGHAVVADGYGYNGSTIFTHLNLGWNGSCDAWYALPAVDAGYDFNVFCAMVYNVYTEESGEALSGRVTDVSGQPVEGVSVTAANGASVYTTQTNARGIYAFILPGNATWTISIGGQTAAGKAVEPQSRSSYLPVSTVNAAGNSWGNDFVIEYIDNRANLYVDEQDTFLSRGNGSYDFATACSVFEHGATIYTHTCFGNNGGRDIETPFNIRYQLFAASNGAATGNAIATENYSMTNAVAAGSKWIRGGDHVWSALQNLDYGEYVLRVTLDSGDVVPETEEADNVYDYPFEIPDADISYIEIDGPAEIDPGESAQYSCRVYLESGKQVDALCIWALDAGANYASLANDGSGILTAGVFTEPKSVLLRATCSFTSKYKTSTMSATKAVAINPALSIPEAVDNFELPFATDDGAFWWGQKSRAYNDGDAARSAKIGHSQSSGFETVVTGPGALSFWYLTSCESSYDRLVCKVNGEVVMEASGVASDWEQYIVLVNANVGQQTTIRWEYIKDACISAGDDAAFVDEVVWETSPVPSCIAIDGPDSVEAMSGAQYSCRVTMTDGTVKTVEPAWAVVEGAEYASIDSAGSFEAFDSRVDRAATISATYSEYGIVLTATKAVQIQKRIPAPGGFYITRAGLGTVTAAVLEWSESSDADAYIVYRSESEDFSTAREIAGNLVSRTFFDTSAVPGVEYIYWIGATNITAETRTDWAEAHRAVSLCVTPDSVHAKAAGEVFTATVRSNTSDWNVAVCGADDPNLDVSWLTVSKSGADGITITVAVNPTVEAYGEDQRARAATIEVTAGANTPHPSLFEISVNQEAPEAPKYPDFTLQPLCFEAGLYAANVADTSTAKTVFEAGEPVALVYPVKNIGEGDFNGTLVASATVLDGNANALLDMLPEYTDGIASGSGFVGVTPPEGLATLAPGVYRAAVVLDPEDAVREEREDNNSATCVFAVRDGITLNEAVDLDESVMLFTADANEASEETWYGTRGLGYGENVDSNGVDCAVTRLAGNNALSTMRASVEGEGTISFRYRVSTEANYDIFTFAIQDGEGEALQLVSDSGIGEWNFVSFDVGKGVHNFLWIYEKDGQGFDGDDTVYVDQVVWTPLHTKDPPAGFSATGDRYDDIALNWDWNVEGDAMYIVQRCLSGDDQEAEESWTEVFNMARNNHASYNAYDKTPQAGLTYLYRIKVVYSNGDESDWSEPVEGYRKTSTTPVGRRIIPGNGASDGIVIRANCAWRVTCDKSWVEFENTEFEMDGDWKVSKLLYTCQPNTTKSSREATVQFWRWNGEDWERGIEDWSGSFKIEQKVASEFGEIVSLSEAADSELVFTTSPEAPWFGQTQYSFDGVDALRSGEIPFNATSRVETVLSTGGTLSFRWSTSSQNSDKLTLYIDGVKEAEIGGYETKNPGKLIAWTEYSVEIPEDGAVVTWAYGTSESEYRGEDAAFIDQIVWEPRERIVRPSDQWWQEMIDSGVITDYTLEEILAMTDDEIRALLERVSPGSPVEYFAPYPLLRGAIDTEGKKDANGNPVTLKQDFIAGTNPKIDNDLFHATIEVVDGKPQVGWYPQLDETEARKRNYTVYGKKTLAPGAEWEPVAEGRETEFSFFWVSVEMK